MSNSQAYDAFWLILPIRTPLGEVRDVEVFITYPGLITLAAGKITVPWRDITLKLLAATFSAYSTSMVSDLLLPALCSV